MAIDSNKASEGGIRQSPQSPQSPRTIRAKVSEKGLQKVHLFFDHSPRTLLGEILQNCRRAKATAVDISVSPSGSGSQIRIVDNGDGIADPQVLLHLWDSGWDDTTQGLESPAGLGFFSLCHLPEGVTVRSHDWEVDISSETFRGQSEATVRKARGLEGTEICFTLPDTSIDNTLRILESVVEFFPIPTRINKQPAKQKDFLEGCVHICPCEGGRIGLIPFSYSSGSKSNINFHGVTLKSSSSLVPQGFGFSALVDIEDNKILDLVLPARNSIVENRKLENLTTQCRKAIYQYLEQSKTPHKLAYKYYEEAKSMGVNLQEASAKLKIAYPTPVHYDQGGWDGSYSKTYPQQCWSHSEDEANPNSILAGDLTDSDIAALHICGAEIPLMFTPDESMEGYSWYPKNKAIGLSQVMEMPKGKTLKFPTSDLSPAQTKTWEKLNRENKDHHPKKIELELCLKMSQDGGRSEISIEKFPTNIAINTDYSGEDGLYSGWLPSQNPKSQELIDTDILKSLFFNPSEDYESDSIESQEDYFEKEADSVIAWTFKGKDGAKIHDLNVALNTWEVKSAIRELGASSLTLEVTEDGQVKFKKMSKPKSSKKSKTPEGPEM